MGMGKSTILNALIKNKEYFQTGKYKGRVTTDINIYKNYLFNDKNNPFIEFWDVPGLTDSGKERESLE